MQNSGQVRFLTCVGYFMMVALMGLGVALAFFGSRELSEAREFPTPVKLTVGEFVRSKPDHGWFEITGGRLNVRQAVWEEQIGAGTIRRAFVPLYGQDQIQSGKSAVLVETKDPDILSRLPQPNASPAIHGGFPGMPPNMGGFFDQSIVRSVKGRVPGFRRADVMSGRMSAVHIDLRSILAPDYIYLAEGEAPSTGAGWGFIALGAVLVALFGAVMVKMVQEQAAKRG